MSLDTPLTYTILSDGDSLHGESPESKKWSTGLFEVGDISFCLASFLCPCVALGLARHSLDGSNIIGNCFFLRPSSGRWLIRTAYGIDGEAHEDCWLGILCSCCVINQLLQTTKQRGRVLVQNLGPEYNTRPSKWLMQIDTQTCYNLFYAALCNPCSTGIALESIGAPLWFGACCFNPFSAASALRYHYQKKPGVVDEFVTDAVIPVIGTFGLTCITGHVIPAVYTWYAFANLSDENDRVGRRGCYGLDVPACCSYTGDYFLTCQCKAPEGRYLSGNRIIEDANPEIVINL